MAGYYTPPDPLVGLLERRMLYLLKDNTMNYYFSDTAYCEVLRDFCLRIPSIPAELQYPSNGTENLDKTNELVALLAEALSTPQLAKSLEQLCIKKVSLKTTNPGLWALTGLVENDTKIFVPYFHCDDDNVAVAALFNSAAFGFLNPQSPASGKAGWQGKKVQELFQIGLVDLENGTQNDQDRGKSLQEAKRLSIVRPGL